MLQIYNEGFINLDKQFLTIGINGFVEGAEFLGYRISPDDENYKQYAIDILTTIKDLNKRDRQPHCKFNTEFVPAESLGVKNANGTKKMDIGYLVMYIIHTSTSSKIHIPHLSRNLN